jgi:hypothetical protein
MATTNSIRVRLAILLVAVAASLSALVATAEAGVSLPNGGFADVTIGCDDVLRTLDVTTRYQGADASNAYYTLWAYGYSTKQFEKLTGWTKLNNYQAAGPFSGTQQWYAFYAQYAVPANGQWRFGGEWIVVTQKFVGTSGYWCSI